MGDLSKSPPARELVNPQDEDMDIKMVNQTDKVYSKSKQQSPLKRETPKRNKIQRKVLDQKNQT